MKTCVCNKEINDEYEFCPYCGEYVGNKKGYGIYSIKTNNVDLGIFKGTISDIAFYLSKCNLSSLEFIPIEIQKPEENDNKYTVINCKQIKDYKNKLNDVEIITNVYDKSTIIIKRRK